MAAFAGLVLSDQLAASPHNNQPVSAATVFLSHNNQSISAKFQTSERARVIPIEHWLMLTYAAFSS